MTLNYIAILVVGIIAMILGVLWYSPLLFGKLWMEAMGMSEQSMKKAKKNSNMGGIMTAALLANFVYAWVLAYLVAALGAVDFAAGAMIGFWMWFGFIMTATLSPVLWENKKLSLYWIYGSYALTVALISGGILAIWR